MTLNRGQGHISLTIAFITWNSLGLTLIFIYIYLYIIDKL